MFCTSCGIEQSVDANFCSRCGARLSVSPDALTSTNSGADTDTLLAILAHIGGIFLGFIPALVVFLVKKDDQGWVLDSARNALNWQLTLLIAGVVLMVTIIGMLLFWPLWVLNVVFCIIGTVKASNKQVYQYPLTIRLLK
jgi:uncharacterized Tic20 family protein